MQCTLFVNIDPLNTGFTGLVLPFELMTNLMFSSKKIFYLLHGWTTWKVLNTFLHEKDAINAKLQSFRCSQ